jgi:hypothetical protein
MCCQCVANVLPMCVQRVRNCLAFATHKLYIYIYMSSIYVCSTNVLLMDTFQRVRKDLAIAQMDFQHIRREHIYRGHIYIYIYIYIYTIS